MDIEEQKRRFLDLLRTVYKAELVTTGRWVMETDRNKELLQIPRETLTRHGFDGHDFWYLICPSLQTDGFLRNYIEPSILSDGRPYTPTFEINAEKLLAPTNKDDLGVEKEHGDSIFVFELTKDGTLTRKVSIEGDTPYAMEKDSRRHKVLKAIVSCKSGSFCQTSDLAEGIGCSTETFSRTCGELKTQLCNHFSGILRDEVIDSKPRSGYRINPKARIIEIR